MEFHVPQHIDVENKIALDLTFLQIFYLVGGIFISYVLWQAFPFYVSILPIGAIATVSILLAFFPKDRYGKEFRYILEDAFYFYFTKPRLYTWKKIENMKAKEVKKKKRNTVSVTVPDISNSNLKQLAWSLDVKKDI